MPYLPRWPARPPRPAAVTLATDSTPTICQSLTVTGPLAGRVPYRRIFTAPLVLASTRWRVQISHFGAVRVRPGVSAFWWRSCLAVPGTRLAAGLGA
jgi:hypothetical protein